VAVKIAQQFTVKPPEFDGVLVAGRENEGTVMRDVDRGDVGRVAKLQDQVRFTGRGREDRRWRRWLDEAWLWWRWK
jgi:hypothetical protein